jgi:hypothetical protein
MKSVRLQKRTSVSAATVGRLPIALPISMNDVPTVQRTLAWLPKNAFTRSGIEHLTIMTTRTPTSIGRPPTTKF